MNGKLFYFAAMRKVVIILSISLPFIAFAFWYANKQGFFDDFTLPDIVPDHSHVLFTIEDFARFRYQFQQNPMDSALQELPFFDQVSVFLAKADTLLPQGWMQKRPLAVSIHQAARNDISYMVYTPIGSVVRNQLIKRLKSGSALGSPISFHEYEGQDIWEFSINGTDYALLILANYMVVSEKAFLIEDVIRQLKEDRQAGFFTFSAVEDTRMVFNLSRLPDLLDIFLSESHEKWKGLTKGFQGSVSLQYDFTKNSMLWSGSNQVSTVGYPPIATVSLWNYVPSNSSIIALMPFGKDRWGGFDNQSEAFQRLYSIDHDEFLKNAGLGAFVQLENISGSDDYILIVKPADPDLFDREIRQLNSRIIQDEGDSLYTESYLDVTISEIPSTDFLPDLFGSFFYNSHTYWYARDKDHFIFTNTLSAMKQLFTDYDQEKTWARSVSKNKWLELTLESFTEGLVVNPELLMNFLQRNGDAAWNNLFGNEQFWLSWPLIGFQTSYVNNVQFVNGFAFFHPVEVPGSNSVVNTIVRTNFESELVSRPHAITKDRQFRFFVQDSASMLHLLSTDGDLLTSTQIDGAIVSGPHRFDYEKDGLQDIVFATGGSIYVVNGEGRILKGFPKSLEDGNATIRQMSVVDYDNSGRYRYFITTDDRKLWLTDKEVNVLNGWNGLELPGRMSFAPFHFRHKVFDFMVSVTSNGHVEIRNRRGNFIPGFPINLELQFSSSPYIEQGNSLEDTRIMLVSDRGVLVHLNMNGEIVYREQLFRPMEESNFRLVPDELGATFLIARKDFNRVSIQDRQGNTMFEKDYAIGEEIEVQYYRFSSSRQLISVTDMEQEFTYLYDEEGNFINLQPINNSYGIALIYSEASNIYKLFYTFDHAFNVATF